MAYGIWGAFHFLFLLPLALWTNANLNSMLCPAISDPFRGPNYMLHALWHQVGLPTSAFPYKIALYLMALPSVKLLLSCAIFVRGFSAIFYFSDSRQVELDKSIKFFLRGEQVIPQRRSFKKALSYLWHPDFNLCFDNSREQT